MIFPDFITSLLPMTRVASAVLNRGVANGEIEVVSRVPGSFGNRFTVKVVIDSGGGVPVFNFDGETAVLRFSSQPIFEASGPFFVNGNPTLAFDWLWYAGIENSKPSWSLDGEPVGWPIARDGTFFVFGGGSWNMIRREAGLVTMHWKSDSQESDIYLIPRAEKSAETPDGWYGGVPECTGYVDAHYGIDVIEAQHFVSLLPGLPDQNLNPNEFLNRRLSFTLAQGQTGTARLRNSTEARLSGGQ